ncbi:hypothetical protein GZH47_33405 (plasmid) [Paenibacillus rhizovicinus]|uniref:Uncharacterized protein n=1 Tax=Paenibacillus rhizovicinus TaxID=2704463 RepID=A0A6C0PCZ2_9BACL|nr:hypothetical protein [Paenibacillus rhizovicinus]QHW35792.1 hypothetical protein GZH47_33405 [Paenibacillus rhizovicinus]
MDINLHSRFKNTNTGLNGTLCPNGEFIPCEYGCHEADANVYRLYAVAAKLGLRSRRSLEESMYEFVKRMGFVTMGSRGPDKEVFSHLRIEGAEKMSMNQVEWFVTHFKELDEIQRQFLLDYWREVNILVEIPGEEGPVAGDQKEV